MDFSQVTDVNIPQGVVEYITDDVEGSTRLLWRRPFKFPAFTFYFRVRLANPKVTVYNLPWALRDEYGRNKGLGPATATPITNPDGSLNVYYSDSVILLPPDDGNIVDIGYESPHTWIKHGVCDIVFRKAYNNDQVIETQGITFSHDWPKAYPTFNINSGSHKIKLYAASDLVKWGWSPMGEWAIGEPKIQNEPYKPYKKIQFKLKEHETDVVVTAQKYLIQDTYINPADKFNIEILKFCDNFDWYRNAYDLATGGKFPKSTYPYLVGVEPLLAKNFPNHKSLYSDLDDGLMYIGFKVKR